MRFLNLTLRIFGFLFALAVAVPVLVIGALQFPAGRNLASGIVSSLASNETQTIEVKGLFISFTLDAAVEEIVLADPEGTWLNVDGIAVKWNPLKLFSGDLEFNSVEAERIDLARLPSQPAVEPPPSEESESTGGLSLPLNVSLQSLKLTEVNLGEPLIGAPVSLTASGSGSFALDPALVTAKLDIQRVDGVDASLKAAAEFEPAAETLAFDIAVSEPRGGLAARLLDVPDLPAIQMSLKGDGPLTNWAANLNLALDGHTTVTGSAQIEEKSSERVLTFDLDGDLAPLAPPAAHVFLLGTTDASGTATFSNTFAPRSADVALTTQTVSLQANAALTDGVIDAKGTLNVDAGGGALVGMDIGERRVAFGPLDLQFSASGEQTAADWSTNIDLSSFQTTEARTGNVTLNASGNGADLTPGVLFSPFDIDLSIANLEGLTPQTEPLSGNLSLKGTGTADGGKQSIRLNDLSLNTPAAIVALTDFDLSADKVSGQGRASLADLAKFDGLAGRELGGSISASFSTDLDPANVAGSVTAALVTNDLKTGVPQANALLEGSSQIDANVVLAGQNDVTLKSFALKNEAIEATGKAHYQDASLSSNLSASLADLSKADPQLAGSLDLNAETSGKIDALNVKADASSKQIMLAGTPLDNLKFSADATADLEAPTAVVKSSASLNGQPIAIDVELTSSEGGADINPLSLKLAGNTVSGALSVGNLDQPVETLKGDLTIDAPDLASLSPLLLTEISGNLQGTVKADPDKKSVDLDITGTDIDVPSVSVGNLKLVANVAAPFSPETLTADIEVSDLITDATPIHEAKILAKPENGGTAISADIKIDKGTKDGLTLAAQVKQPESNSYVVALSDLAMRYQGISSRLKQPTSISYANGDAKIQPLELELGSGSLAVSGTAGNNLDLSADLKSVPLNLANAFVPSLGLGGTLSGNISANGTSASPEATWSITGSGLTATELKNNGIALLGLQSSGTLKDNQVSQTTKVSDPNGLNLSAAGTVGLAQPNPLSITLDGTVPVAALKRPMLEAGLRGEGAISLKGKVSGSATSPAYQITATPSGLKVTSLSTGLTVQNISGTAAVTQDQASLNNIAGELATGGTLSATGTVGMKNGFPTDLAIKLNRGRYVDPGLVTAEVDADLKISGPLASTSSSALIGGTITINKADVSIPEYLPGAIPPVEVRHVNASKAIQRQVEELGGGERQNQTEQKTFPPRLDIVLSAPGRIFIRGRGLDAELQGNLKIVGTTADPQAIGAFSLKRGQLDILTRRLVFSRGSATFEGSLTPLIDFAATTTVSNTTITVTVRGEADDPQIAFTSSPELPQDEVLALLLFGKSVGNLSATQVASLAAAIATLTGGSDNGPLATIRKSLGLDAIDINTDEEGGTSVSVGKYINDNIYLGVEQGTGTGSSRVKVDIDLDRGLKVRGEVGADGSSKAGIFFEREY
ncbi:translocation/assembly module TamB domain-containing protein [Roseibium sp. SCPC15]|uniref:translocation/assembly module TamB domain-containing protein n=1 Tax=Roseibium sp. SCP15 TaxID=3141376 RepID=UPI0033395C05